MSTLRKVTEYSGTRRYRYPDSTNKSEGISSGPRNWNQSKFAHKYREYFIIDRDDKKFYVIQLDVGDFSSDEINVRTEGKKIIVRAQKKSKEGREEFSQELKQVFALPDDVDPFSVESRLDQEKHELTLIGKIKDDEALIEDRQKRQSLLKEKVGSTRDTQSSDKTIDYEINLGFELKDGSINLEYKGGESNTLLVLVKKIEADKYGESISELKRSIKLPHNADANNIKHDLNGTTLVIRVHLK